MSTRLPCKQCGKTFSSESELFQHNLTWNHHQTAQKKPQEVHRDPSPVNPVLPAAMHPIVIPARTSRYIRPLWVPPQPSHLPFNPFPPLPHPRPRAHPPKIFRLTGPPDPRIATAGTWSPSQSFAAPVRDPHQNSREPPSQPRVHETAKHTPTLQERLPQPVTKDSGTWTSPPSTSKGPTSTLDSTRAQCHHGQHPNSDDSRMHTSHPVGVKAANERLGSLDGGKAPNSAAGVDSGRYEWHRSLIDLAMDARTPPGQMQSPSFSKKKKPSYDANKVPRIRPKPPRNRKKLPPVVDSSPKLEPPVAARHIRRNVPGGEEVSVYPPRFPVDENFLPLEMETDAAQVETTASLTPNSRVSAYAANTAASGSNSKGPPPGTCRQPACSRAVHMYSDETMTVDYSMRSLQPQSSSGANQGAKNARRKDSTSNHVTALTSRACTPAKTAMSSKFPPPREVITSGDETNYETLNMDLDTEESSQDPFSPKYSTSLSSSAAVAPQTPLVTASVPLPSAYETVFESSHRLVHPSKNIVSSLIHIIPATSGAVTHSESLTKLFKSTSVVLASVPEATPSGSPLTPASQSISTLTSLTQYGVNTKRVETQPATANIVPVSASSSLDSVLSSVLQASLESCIDSASKNRGTPTESRNATMNKQPKSSVVDSSSSSSKRKASSASSLGKATSTAAKYRSSTQSGFDRIASLTEITAEVQRHLMFVEAEKLHALGTPLPHQKQNRRPSQSEMVALAGRNVQSSSDSDWASPDADPSISQLPIQAGTSHKSPGTESSGRGSSSPDAERQTTPILSPTDTSKRPTSLPQLQPTERSKDVPMETNQQDSSSERRKLGTYSPTNPEGPSEAALSSVVKSEPISPEPRSGGGDSNPHRKCTWTTCNNPVAESSGSLCVEHTELAKVHFEPPSLNAPAPSQKSRSTRQQQVLFGELTGAPSWLIPSFNQPTTPGSDGSRPERIKSARTGKGSSKSKKADSRRAAKTHSMREVSQGARGGRKRNCSSGSTTEDEGEPPLKKRRRKRGGKATEGERDRREEDASAKSVESTQVSTPSTPVPVTTATSSTPSATPGTSTTSAIMSPSSAASSYLVEISALNSREQQLQQDLLEARTRLSEVCMRMEEKERTVEELKREEPLLLDKLQTLIRQYEEVLEQKKTLIAQTVFRPRNEEGPSASPRLSLESEMATLNQSDQQLQEELAGVHSEVCEVRRRMGEQERELEGLSREQQALEDKCERLTSNYQELLTQKQRLLQQPIPRSSPSSATPSLLSSSRSSHETGKKTSEMKPGSTLVANNVTSDATVGQKDGKPENDGREGDLAVGGEEATSTLASAGDEKSVVGGTDSSPAREEREPSTPMEEGRGEQVEVDDGVMIGTVSASPGASNEHSSVAEEDQRSPTTPREEEPTEEDSTSAGHALSREEGSRDVPCFEPHLNSVLSMRVSGNRLYTCSADKSIRAYDTQTGAIIVPNYGDHTRSVTCLELWHSGSATYLVSGSSDKTVNIYNAESTKVVAKFKIGVRILFMRVQGAMLFVGLSSGSVIVINLQELKEAVVGKYTCHPNHSSISCLCTTERLLFSAAFDMTVACWDTSTALSGGRIGYQDTFDLLHRFTSFTNTVLCMEVHQDRLFIGSGDATVQIYKIGTWEQLDVIECHNDAVSGLVIIGRVLITACFDKLVRCFDLERLELLQVYGGYPDMVFTLCAASGVIYTGMKNGVIQATTLDLTVFYKCQWQDCGLRFGVLDHLKEHVKAHLSSSGPTTCLWSSCNQTVEQTSALQHVHEHIQTAER